MTSSVTLQLQRCLDRLHAGDVNARDDLLRCACDRLVLLTRKMLKSYPGVQRWEQTGDVLQNASMRLCRALQDVTPATVRDFFRLAALQIRRELLDLTKHYYGPEGHGAKHATHREKPNGEEQPTPDCDTPDLTHEPARLAVWREFHEAIGNLPDTEREVFDLLWYQGLTQAEAAELLQVSERTVKRYWQSARLKLHEALHGQLPE